METVGILLNRILEQAFQWGLVVLHYLLQNDLFQMLATLGVMSAGFAVMLHYGLGLKSIHTQKAFFLPFFIILLPVKWGLQIIGIWNSAQREKKEEPEWKYSPSF